jgi:hypothetical protein
VILDAMQQQLKIHLAPQNHARRATVVTFLRK